MNYNRRRIRLEEGSLVRRPPKARIGTGIPPTTRLATQGGRVYVVTKNGNWVRETPKEKR